MKEKKSSERFFKLQAAESNDEVDIYMVILPKTKADVFHLVCFYVAYGATFQMTDNLTGAAYGVIENPPLRACSDHLVVIHVAVKYTSNFQWILDLLQLLWAFSIALNGSTHHVTLYFDLRAQI